MLIGRPHPRLSCAVIDSPISQMKSKKLSAFYGTLFTRYFGKTRVLFRVEFRANVSGAEKRERDEKEELCRMRRGVEFGWIQGHSLLYNTTMKAPSTQGHYNTHAEGGERLFEAFTCFFDQIGKLQLGNAIYVLTE